MCTTSLLLHLITPDYALYISNCFTEREEGRGLREREARMKERKKKGGCPRCWRQPLGVPSKTPFSRALIAKAQKRQRWWSTKRPRIKYACSLNCTSHNPKKTLRSSRLFPSQHNNKWFCMKQAEWKVVYERTLAETQTFKAGTHQSTKASITTWNAIL